MSVFKLLHKEILTQQCNKDFCEKKKEILKGIVLCFSTISVGKSLWAMTKHKAICAVKLMSQGQNTTVWLNPTPTLPFDSEMLIFNAFRLNELISVELLRSPNVTINIKALINVITKGHWCSESTGCWLLSFVIFAVFNQWGPFMFSMAYWNEGERQKCLRADLVEIAKRKK